MNQKNLLTRRAQRVLVLVASAISSSNGVSRRSHQPPAAKGRVSAMFVLGDSILHKNLSLRPCNGSDSTLLPHLLVSSNETDRLALLEFKSKITDNSFGVMSSRNSFILFCSWSGVTCAQRHQRVTALDLSSHNLAGSISLYTGNLSFLRDLILQNNSIVPLEVGRLNRLKSYIPANLSTSRSLSSSSTCLPTSCQKKYQKRLIFE